MPVTNPSRTITTTWAGFAPPADVNPVPDADQTGTNPRGASFDTGFPTITLTPSSSGGLPPDGADMNGVLNIITSHVRHLNIGRLYKFDAAVSTAIGGYDIGTVLQANDGLAAYVSTVDNNTIDFNITPSSIGVQWKQWAGGAIAVGAPVYTEDDKWELCPVGHCQPFVENIVGLELVAWLASHPNWEELQNIAYLNISHTVPGSAIAGRAIAVPGNGHNKHTTAGSDNATLIAHTHTANDVSHSHAYKDRYYSEENNYLSARLRPGDKKILLGHTGAGSSGTDTDNNAALYVDDVTSAANLSISVSSSGSGAGINANIQRTVYLPWIIKIS